MVIVPAIDLIDGRCVRLKQGVYENKTVYSESPVDTALQMCDLGAARIHLVDLDAAKGNGNNHRLIRKIRKAVSCILELGGGLRSKEEIAAMLDMGIDYAVVGTLIAQQTEVVASFAAEIRGKIIASVDVRGGLVQTGGWMNETTLRAQDLVQQVGDMNLAAIQYTCIERDGMMNGPDIEGALHIAKNTTLPVFLSGGIRHVCDAQTVALHKRIAGIIVGRALYEGHFDLSEAIQNMKEIHV